MKRIDGVEPSWPPCLLTFMGCGNAKWLIRIPINASKEIILNHPHTGEMVTLIYKGNHPKRQEVSVFTQESEAHTPPSPRYTGGGYGRFT